MISLVLFSSVFLLEKLDIITPVSLVSRKKLRINYLHSLLCVL
uniref:Uncharacterized protein n=1 Tax=Rhizophora mucronata TaxID=61149 RepID=A0A2P2NQG4_RHIMU